MEHITGLFDCYVTSLKNVIQIPCTGCSKQLAQGFTKFAGKIFRYFITNEILPLSGLMVEEGTDCDFNQITHDLASKPHSFATIIDNCKKYPIKLYVIEHYFNEYSDDILQSYRIADRVKSNMAVVDNKITVYGMVFDVSGNVFSYKNVTSFFGFNGLSCSYENLKDFVWKEYATYSGIKDLMWHEYASSSLGGYPYNKPFSSATVVDMNHNQIPNCDDDNNWWVTPMHIGIYVLMTALSLIGVYVGYKIGQSRNRNTEDIVDNHPHSIDIHDEQDLHHSLIGVINAEDT